MAFSILNLQQIFGENATQDIDTLIIKKSDLIGLTASPSNTAESLLVAILLRASYAFEGSIGDEHGNKLSDEHGNSIGYSYRTFYEFLNVFIWEPKYVVRDENQLFIKDTIVAESYSNLPAWE
ncbi:hypothetical protein [Nostoc punctiforme]|uniref:hypothetical protein n=1 Tax=Nostoc punctiforme TaxID=272131 RepID=UPI000045C12C|nr:hypothetical protein [Nostoc punctiforme]